MRERGGRRRRELEEKRRIRGEDELKGEKILEREEGERWERSNRESVDRVKRGKVIKRKRRKEEMEVPGEKCVYMCA